MHYSLKRAALWNIAGYAYLIVSSFISTRLLLQGLGIRQFAVYVLLVATVNLVSSLDLGLSQAVIRKLAEFHGDQKSQRRVWSSAYRLYGIVTIGGALITFAVVRYFLHTGSTLAIFVAAWSALTSFLGFYSTLPQAVGKFGWYNLRTFIVGTANTLLVGAAAIAGWGLMGLVSVQIIAASAVLLLFVFFKRRILGTGGGKYYREIGLGLLSYGLKNQLGKLVGQGQVQYGKYVLASFSPVAVSAYTIARGLVTNLAGGVTQLSTAFFPAIGAATDKKKINRVYRTLQFTLIACGVTAIAMYSLWGKTFIVWWLGEPILASQVDELMKIFVWYFALLILSPLGSSVLDGRGKPGLTSLYSVLAFAIEIIFVYLTISFLGTRALPFGSLLSLILLMPSFLFQVEITLQAIRGK